MNFKMIVYLLGNILRVEGLLMLVPVIAAVCFLEKTAATALIASAGLCLIIGTKLLCASFSGPDWLVRRTLTVTEFKPKPWPRTPGFGSWVLVPPTLKKR